MRNRAFVLSCGRTGSTALAAYIRYVHPEFTVRHEPFQWSLLRRMSIRLSAGRSDFRDATRLLKVQRAIELHRSRGTYIETTPALWGFTPILPRVFPGATLIHLIRHPYDYVASALRFRSQSHLKGFVNSVVPDFFPRPEYYGISRSLDSMSAAERAAWFWNITNRYILENQPENSCIIQRFHFEDVFGPDHRTETALDLAEHLAINRKPQFLDKLRGSPVNATRRTESAEARQINRTDPAIRLAVQEWASCLADQLGYDI